MSLEGIEYVEMTDDRFDAAVVEMMKGLYAEDLATGPHDPAGFARTLGVLRAEAWRGRVILFLGEDESLHGYAIVVPLWSNELGGNVAFVDELYVRPGSRRLGVARGFLEFVELGKVFDAVAVSLEVSPKNEKAWGLYVACGFEARPFTTMVRRVLGG